MKNRRILDALGLIDDTYIEEAAPAPKKAHPKSWIRYAAAAACLTFAAGTAVFFLSDRPVISPQQTVRDSSQTASDGVTIPPYELDLLAGGTYDMISFFIYEGRSYVAYETLPKDVDFVGDYLGTSTGLIDEWTPKDGYVDFAGSISGDIYSVDGYDPEFMLCMRHPTGTVTTFINDNGITLHTGRELFEDRLHITGRIQEFYYQQHEDWFYNTDHYLTLSKDDFSLVEALLSSLNNTNFMLTDDVPLPTEAKTIYDTQLAHLFLRLENQMTVHLRLFEGGYVSFDGLNHVCLKADVTIFDNLLSLLTSPESALSADIKDSPSSPLTYEDCLELPEFGQYVPPYIPSDTYTESTQIVYEIDRPTGDITDTGILKINQIGEEFWYQLSLVKTDIYHDISQVWTDLYGNDEPLPYLIDPNGFSLETITKYGNPDGEIADTDEPGNIIVYMQFDEMMIILDSHRLSAQTAYDIMKSLLDKVSDYPQ